MQVLHFIPLFHDVERGILYDPTLGEGRPAWKSSFEAVGNVGDQVVFVS
jgi:hypothetical protein